MNLHLHPPKRKTRARIKCTFGNKMWINTALNNEAYFSFERVSSDHRIVSAKIRLSPRKIWKKQLKLYNITGSYFPVVILEIIMRYV